MPATLKKIVDRPDEWKTLDLGDGAAIEVLMRRPTAAEIIAGYGSRDEYAVHRVRVTVADWRGVDDESGKPVPFSLEALERLIEQFYMAGPRLIRLADDAFFGLAETERKNLSAPSATSHGDGGTTETTTSTDGSTTASSEPPQSPPESPST